MPTPPLSDEKCREAMALLAKHGSVAAAARASGIDRTTLYSRIAAATRRGYGPQGEDGPSPADRREVQSADFWRKRAKALEGQIATAENLIEQLSGLVTRPLEPPPFITPIRSGGDHRAVGLLHISDIHAGEVVPPDEVNGINGYDLDTCKRRLGRLFHATIEILPRWASDSDLVGIVVAFNGDLVSGSIHEELAETDALVSQQQAWFVADELAAGLRALADAFKSVFVVVTPGNHGRQTKKPRFKRIAAASYDTAVGEMLRRHFEDDPRLVFHISPSRDAIYPILGWTVWQSHGDQTLRGGNGFAGPVLSIVRGAKAVEWQAAQSKRDFDIMLLAHMHTSANPGKVLANGSVIGLNQFVHGIRGGPEVPKQWLALVHSKWCLRERLDIQLEEPRKPEKPRVRVPARMT